MTNEELRKEVDEYIKRDVELQKVMNAVTQTLNGQDKAKLEAYLHDSLNAFADAFPNDGTLAIVAIAMAVAAMYATAVKTLGQGSPTVERGLTAYIFFQATKYINEMQSSKDSNDEAEGETETQIANMEVKGHA